MRARNSRSGRALAGATLLLITLFGSTAHADTLTLMWDANAESVSGYAVYTGPSPQALSQRIDVGGATSYTLSNAVPGEQYCFAVAAYDGAAGEGPRSASVCGYANQAPSLVNPGSLSATVGEPTSVQLSGSDPDGDPLTYSASGLPPGLSIMQSTGFVSGTPAAGGTYQVTAGVSDGVLSDTESFTWTIDAPPAPSDTTAPNVSIIDPTIGDSYESGSATIAMSGTSSDDVGVTEVQWSNDRGGQGTAIGVAPWSVPDLVLHPGSNQLSVTARDAAGNSRTKVLNVTYLDSAAPVVTITSPTTGDTYANLFSTVMLAGSASDDVGVASVSWSNDRGGAGVASGTSNWSVASVPLQEGDNVITVAATDGRGNVATDVLTVTYVPPVADDPDPVVLVGSVSTKGWRTVGVLGWSPIYGAEVGVLRNGATVARTSNNGKYWEELPGAGTWTYQVCTTDGQLCSNEVALTSETGVESLPPGQRNK